MGGECTSFTDFFETSAHMFPETNFLSAGAASPDDIFSILDALEGVSDDFPAMTPLDRSGCGEKEAASLLMSQKSTSSCSAFQELVEAELDHGSLSPKSKRQKTTALVEDGGANSDGQLTHITVERNRRKQMNEHLTVLRSLMPCFYVKRGDQASIIGGVVDYITELQQVLQSLEAKKQRKVYSDVLSPRAVSSPRKPPLSPRPTVPVSPRTPQPTSPYRLRLLQLSANSSYLSAPSAPPSLNPSPSSSSSTSDPFNELVAVSKSAMADVEVKFSGPNLLLKTLSPRLPGHTSKIISVLEDLSLEILQASISIVDERMVNSFTIKIGIECPLSAEEVVHHVQQTFC